MLRYRSRLRHTKHVTIDCVICSIASGDTPATVVGRSRGALAFLPLEADSLAPCHLVVATDHHLPDILAATADDLAAVMALMQRAARVMGDVVGAGGVDILSANGPASEQSVRHLHLHLVPRWRDDGFTTWPSGRSRHVASDHAVLDVIEALLAVAEHQ